MRKINYLIPLLCGLAAFTYAGQIVPGLDDSTARFSTTVPQNGTLNEIANNTTGLLTFAARFNPDASQADVAPVQLLQYGGTSNGTGVYVVYGDVYFCGKSYGQPGVMPISDNDTDFSDYTIAVKIGSVVYGEENIMFASFNIATGELISKVNDIVKITQVTGSDSGINVDGNLTVGFIGDGVILETGWLGGLTQNADYPEFFNLNCVSMVQTAGYDNQLGQIFDQMADLSVLASNPIPADGAINVDPETVTALQFDAAIDTNVTGHWVRFFQVDNGEPNLLVAPTVSEFIPAGANPISCPVSFELDDVVYWQVEEQISGAAEGASANLYSPIWSFQAALSVPNITTSPATAVVFANDTAGFTCEFFSKAAPTSVQWYRGAGTSNPVSDSDADITIELVQDGYNYTSTLTIANAEVADEDAYWFSVANAVGSDDSDAANLAIKRELAHWTLDAADMVGGQYLDVSGAGHNADPNIIPDAAAIVDGAVGEAVDFTIDPQNNVGNGGTWDPATGSNEFTVSAWVYNRGLNGQIQGILTKRALGNTYQSWYLNIQANGELRFGTPTENVSTNFNSYYAQWVLVTITDSATEGAVVYINGLRVDGDPLVTPVVTDAPILIGSNYPNLDGTYGDLFNGSIDDVRIFNYALSAGEAAMLYYDVVQTPICMDPSAEVVKFDVTGDCKVDLADFAEFAGDWLNSNLCPGPGCE
ncbi:MAG: LamG-like jellyroll fold domain-containing protein [Phycisphaerae bacterium]|jgi:hypothetical protein